MQVADRRTCSLWATDMGRPKEKRQISTLHSTGGTFCLSSIVNILFIYSVSVRFRFSIRVRDSPWVTGMSARIRSHCLN